jgi:diguanylate cyclase (GGDEF)-like protein
VDFQATGAPGARSVVTTAGGSSGSTARVRLQCRARTVDAARVAEAGTVEARSGLPGPRVAVFSRCAAAPTVADACSALADELHERFALPSVYLLVDGRLRCQAARGYFQVVDGFTPSTGVIGRVVTSGRAVVLHDVRTAPDFISAIPGLASEACFPVRAGGVVVGAINLESATRLPDDVEAQLALAAQHLGSAIERLGGLPPVPLAQRLARIAVGLTSLTDSSEIRLRAVQGAVEVSGMSSAALSQPDGTGSWEVVAATGPLAATLADWDDQSHRVMAGWVDAGTSSHFPGVEVPPGYEFLLRAGVRAIAVQPLVAGGRVTGLLTTADTRTVPHDPTVGAAVELLAAQTAASLANAEAMDELSRRAQEDPLTGLRNAAAFAGDLHAAPTGTACLLVDVDHFKQVNDTYGHVAGDRLLCALADELSAHLRDDTTVYRVGGDELAVLLPAGAGDAVVVAQRLLDAARRVRTTVSIGVALVGPDNPQVARLRADKALYRAKSQGRDRYAVAALDDGAGATAA